MCSSDLCAFAHFPIDDTQSGRKIIIHSRVDHSQREAVLATEEIDASAATFYEVNALLPSYFLRRYADPLFRDTVIGSENKVERLSQRRVERLLNQPYL